MEDVYYLDINNNIRHTYINMYYVNNGGGIASKEKFCELNDLFMIKEDARLEQLKRKI